MMNLVINKPRIKIGNSINLSRKIKTYDYSSPVWCPVHFSKLMRHLSDEKFIFDFSKSNNRKYRYFYVHCSQCNRQILIIKFDHHLLFIEVQFSHICYHMPINKIDKNGKTVYVLSLQTSN